MTQFSVSARLTYAVRSSSSFAFAIAAARTRRQHIDDEVVAVSGGRPSQLVPYGEGTHQLLRLSTGRGDLEIGYRATVSLDAATHRADPTDELSFDDIPPDVLPYLNPSRYCESDRLGSFAARTFGVSSGGHDRVTEVSRWVTDHLAYEPGSTDGSSSATDVLLQRAGVCRDFAHVAISLCRALGIPARYVSGYGIGVEPQDFHGFFEAYVGGRWMLHDPTDMTEPHDLIRIGYGRDAADAPFATLVGDAVLEGKEVDVVRGVPCR